MINIWTGWGRIMEDIICVSSGSDDDSDLEVISSYNDDKEDPVPFIRAQWLSVTPVSLFNYFFCSFSVAYHTHKFCFFSSLNFYQFLCRAFTFTWFPYAKRHICLEWCVILFLFLHVVFAFYTWRADHSCRRRWHAHRWRYFELFIIF